ncbi:MAG TPA: Gfo/Idh/MocA family oxidoreductase [archaeon]|nr:Gfo/Idh/MocA family oxidoreductase [archaeon]
MKPVRIVIVGGGCRGAGFAAFASRNPHLVQVVGIAEPRDIQRERIAKDHNIDSRNIFSDWQDLARRDRIADAAIIATQDDLHVEPTIALAARGYNILLEKPMAPDEAGCRRIVENIEQRGLIFAVAHVLRYTPYTIKLKEMIDSGAIGEVVCIQHLEPVGYWHQAHSFVRGNWRKESESSPMLLAKSCHDLDWIKYIIGERCLAVSSFGSLKHFRREEKPGNAGDRCLDCAYESKCPYSAKKIYLERVRRNQTDWPVNVLTTDLTLEGVTRALEHGPYGRCVYESDNDVVDNQVVNMLFENGKTASFTMTGFNAYADRKTHIFGTRGEIYGDGCRIQHFDFLSDETVETRIEASDFTILGGHAGGDDGLMNSFVAAVADNEPGIILSGAQESLESHLMVFAAEKARRDNTVVRI